jgi:predicted HAD superfamily Cof-like phosphohydrolase
VPESPSQFLREFHAYVGASIRSEPTVAVDGATLRCDFIDEEAAELRLAVSRGDVVGVADALGDLAYVVYGAALHFGIDLDAVVAEVHRSNMTKTPAGNGKAIKGPSYVEPDLRRVLAQHRVP